MRGAFAAQEMVTRSNLFFSVTTQLDITTHSPYLVFFLIKGRKNF